MAQAGRVGDIGVGVCAAHPIPIPIITTISTGAPTVMVNGSPVSTAISIGISSCGHASIVMSFSATVNSGGNGIHRVGDVGALPSGVYTLATGSPNTIVGG